MNRCAVCLVFLVCGPGVSIAQDSAIPLYDGLGGFGRKVTTSSPLAQQYFDQGLCFLYAFNHDEAIRLFGEAARIDPQCGMAWWGMAIAQGPHINNPVVTEAQAAAASLALTKARAVAALTSPVEQALIEAAGRRYAAPQPADRTPLDQAYATAMQALWKKHPADADVGALCAEALMDLRPWDLWTEDRQPQPGTEEIVSLLERVLEIAPKHPLALHLYVHAVEASSQPEKADAAADRLRDLQPGLGHMVHMPSHIDVLRGRWFEAMEANRLAIEADRAYRRRSARQEFYRIYMGHNHHMLAYAAMMRGQSQVALQAITEMSEAFPDEWVKENAALADGFTAMPLEVLVRFGKWEEILAAPEPPESLPIARALRRTARGIALAAQGKVTAAREEQTAFLAARDATPADARFGNNEARSLFAVAEHLLAGEILTREGRIDEGLAELRTAVACEDRLRYDEPPDWIHPVRHALGATLLQAGRAREAEQVYRADLKKHPENGWSLFGLSRALQMQGQKTASRQIQRRFEAAWKDADITITSSCFCQPGR